MNITIAFSNIGLDRNFWKIRWDLIERVFVGTIARNRGTMKTIRTRKLGR